MTDAAEVLAEAWVRREGVASSLAALIPEARSGLLTHYEKEPDALLSLAGPSFPRRVVLEQEAPDAAVTVRLLAEFPIVRRSGESLMTYRLSGVLKEDQ